MFTTDGRYFTGHKTYWHAVPEKSGVVKDITVAVVAFDNEGRRFQTKEELLTPDQVARSTTGTRGHQEVVDELVRDAYERGCALELLQAVKVNNGDKASGQTEGSGQSSTAGQDQGDVPPSAE